MSDESPDDGVEATSAGVHSEPVWTGDAEAYQLDAPADIAGLDVHLISEETSTELVTAPTTAGAAGTPVVSPRSAWGARAPKSTPQIASGLELAVVHHSAGGNGYTAAEVPAVLRSIQAYHQDVQDWSDIAYNFAIDRFGRTWEARAGGIGEAVIGGHSAGFNTGSVGVVVLGSFVSTPVPSAVTEAVANLISWKFAIHDVYPASTVAYTTITGSAKYPAGTTVTMPRIVGHKDVQSTACPGTQLYDKLGQIRGRTAQLWPGHRARTLGRDTVGVRRGSEIFLTNSPNASTVASPFLFGEPQERVVVGDWDGDGTDTLGLRRGAQLILTNEPTGVGPYTTVTYGKATDTPVVGDWDGNGTDTIGVRRDNAYYLRNSNTSGNAEITFAYGKATDTPVVGDWDGNITETPGIRRGNAYYLRNSNSTGNAQITFGYGTAADTPITGDWDGNGTDTPGVRRGNSFYLRNTNTSGHAQTTFSLGRAADTPLVGDWDDR